MRADQQTLQIVTDAISAPVTLCSRDLRYLWVSKPYADWIGLPSDEIVGRPIRDILGEDMFRQLLPRFEQVLAGREVRYEAEVSLKNLGLRWINAIYTPTFDQAGVADGWVAVVLDVSEQKRVEKQDQKNLEIFKLVHSIGKVGHWEWNSLTDENKWSPEIEALYGLQPGTFEGTYEAWAKLLHPDDLPKAEEDVQRALETGKYFSEFRVIWPDGSVHWLETRANVFKDGHEKPIRIMGVNMDITERKKAERLLQESEERLASELAATTRLHSLSTRLHSASDLVAGLQDVLENAIETCGADFGNIQLFNPQIGALEIIAQRGFDDDFLDYFGAVRVNDGSACAQAMQRGERIIIEDVELDPTFEPHRPIAAAAGFRAMQSTPLIAHDETVVGMLSTHFQMSHHLSERDQRLLDLYARHAADLIQRFRMEQARKDADRRKDEFLATLAHELRNPLAPLRNSLELLRRSEEKSLVHQARNMMERQVSQMVRLVDDLLDISRITQGKLQLRKERVELADVLNVAIETSLPLIEVSAHKLTISIPSQPLPVRADPVRLAQVFANLLNNAAKYTEKAGHVWLTAEQQDGEVVVSVRDTGIGIAAEHLPHIFNIFSQVEPALERSQGGLGVGLSLVKGLVELHGGTIEARSDGPAKGSEFILHLPVLDALVEVPRQPSGEEASNNHKCRILVVDDLRDAADSLAMMLRMTGHETRTAYDGLEAVQTAVAFQPTVVLLDIGLPKLNGYEVAHRIRTEPWGEKMALVALTGWGQEEDLRHSMEAGFDHHLTKPVEPAALEKLLELVLAKC